MTSSITIRFSASNCIFYNLIIWTLFGFYTLLDNTMWSGCVNEDELFSFYNIFYSTMSIALLSYGYLKRHSRMGQVILYAELVFWIYKLFLIKGGYSTGLGGGPDINVVFYDFIALMLRLLLIKTVFRFTIPAIFLLIMTAVIMNIKFELFRFI